MVDKTCTSHVRIRISTTTRVLQQASSKSVMVSWQRLAGTIIF